MTEEASTVSDERGRVPADSLEEFKKNCDLYSNAVRTGDDANFGATLNNFETWFVWISKGNGSNDQAHYFFETAMPQVGDAVLRRKYETRELADRANLFIQFLLRCLVDRLKLRLKSASVSQHGKDATLDAQHDVFGPGLEQLLSDILNPSNVFYSRHGLPPALPQSPSNSQKRLVLQTGGAAGPDFCKDEEGWVDMLAVGELAQVFVEGDDGTGGGTWVLCRVVQVSPTNTEAQVELISGEWSKELEQSLSDGAPIAAQRAYNDVEKQWIAKEPSVLRAPNFSQKAPLSDPSLEKEEEQVRALLAQENADLLSTQEWTREEQSHRWRQELTVGDMCDARRTDGSWFRSVIVAVSPDPTAIEDSDIDSKLALWTDILTITFIGLAPSADQQISRAARHRLAPLDSMSHGARGKIAAGRALELPLCDFFIYDLSDPPDCVAVPRNIRPAGSLYLVDTLCLFGECQGADAVLKIICTGPSTVQRICWAIALFGNVAHLFSRDYSRDLVPAVFAAVKRAIMSLNDAQVRKLIRSSIDQILDAAERLALRCAGERRERARLVEELALLIIEKKLGSAAIVHRLDGMDLLSDLAGRVLNARQFPGGIQVTRRRVKKAPNERGARTVANAMAPEKLNALSSLMSSKVANLYGPPAPGKGGSSDTVKLSESEIATPNSKRATCAPVAKAKSVEDNLVTEYCRVPVARWLTESSLADWILQVGAIQNAVAGPSSHLEMVKRSNRIVAFLVKNDSFTLQLVDVVWAGLQAALGSDDELVAALYGLLCDLVNLGTGLTAHILSLVETLPVEQYTEKSLELLAEICKRPAQTLPRKDSETMECSDAGCTWTALNLLWYALQDDSTLGASCRHKAHACIKIIINHFATIETLHSFGKAGRSGGGAAVGELPQSQIVDQKRLVETNASSSGEPKNLSDPDLAVMVGVFAAAHQVAMHTPSSDESGRFLRQVLMDKCVDNLSMSQSVLPALNTLRAVVASFPVKPPASASPQGDACESGPLLKGNESRQQVLTWLNVKHDILNKSLADLISSKSDREEDVLGRFEWLIFALTDSDLALGSEQLDILWDTFMSGNVSQQNQALFFRFLCLVAQGFLSSWSANSLEATSLAHETAAATVGTDQAANLPNAAVNASSFAALAPEALEYLFANKLCCEATWATECTGSENTRQHTVHDLPIAGFVCFQAFFVLQNLKAGNLKFATTAAAATAASVVPTDGLQQTNELEVFRLGAKMKAVKFEHLQVVNTSLLGMETVWHIALSGPIGLVSDAAAEMLSRLQLIHVPSLSGQVGKKRKDFIEVCVSKMRDALEENPMNSIKLGRCFSLLSPLLDNTRQPAAATCSVLGDRAWSQLKPHCASSREQIFQVTISNNFRDSTGHGTKWQLRVFAVDPVWRMRETIATRMGFDSSGRKIGVARLRLFVGGKEIKFSSGAQLLRDVPGFSSGATVIVCEKAGGTVKAACAAAVDVKSTELEALSRLSALPSVLISSEPRYYDLFFRVLDACRRPEHDHLAQQIWHLLQALPTDFSLRESIDTAGASLKIARLLDGSTGEMSKLLYVLELIEARLVSNRFDVGFIDQVSPPQQIGGQSAGESPCDASRGAPTSPSQTATVDGTSSCAATDERANWAKAFAQQNGFTLMEACLVRVTEQLSGIDDCASFARNTVLSIFAKVSKLVLEGVSASLCRALPHKDLSWVFAVRPDMGLLIKIQAEIDMSGTSIREPLVGYPFSHTPKIPVDLLTKSDGGHDFAESLATTLDTETAADPSRIKDFFRQFTDPSNIAQESRLTLLADHTMQAIKHCFLAADDGKNTSPTSSLAPKIPVCAWGLALWAISVAGSKPSGNLSERQTSFLVDLCMWAFGTRSSRCSSAVTRRVVHTNLLALASVSDSLLREVLSILLDRVTPSGPTVAVYDDYFQTCQELLIMERGKQSLTAPDDRMRLLISRIRASPVVERSLEAAPVETDRVLQGRLKLVAFVLRYCSVPEAKIPVLSSRDILCFVFSECLFGVDEKNGTAYRCHRLDTRDVAFELASLALDSSVDANTLAYIARCLEGRTVVEGWRLQNFMKKRYQTVPKPVNAAAAVAAGKTALASATDLQEQEGHGWGIDIDTDERADSGYAGLVNLGFICYMNSVMQQLFMVPRIRYGILTAAAPNGDDYAERHAVLEELQRLFANLDLTVKRAYNPTSWCTTYKDGAGDAINIWQQDDAHQFLMQVCDQLDETLKDTQHGKLMSRVLGVSISNQLLCVDERVEVSERAKFKRDNPPTSEYCLTTEVGEQCGDLCTSLENFVAGEVLTDFRWEESGNRPLRTIKRQCLAELNDVFVVQLQRFKMNWETMQGEKINSRFEFPLHLDLFPYSNEGLAWKARGAPKSERYNEKGRAYYTYALAGVVVHSGASVNSGHYYSYIRAKLGSEEQRSQWFEFNDRTVKPFDISGLEEATFGGGVKHGVHGVEIPSVANAYMLFYERVEPLQAESDFIFGRQGDENTCLNKAVLREVCEHLSAKAPMTPETRLALFPGPIAMSISADNKTFSDILLTFSPGLRRIFLSGLPLIPKLIDCTSGDDSKDIVSFLLCTSEFLLKTVARASSNSEFEKISNLLCDAYSAATRSWGPSVSKECLNMILDSSSKPSLGLNLFESIAIVHAPSSVRASFAKFFCVLMSTADVEGWDRIDDFNECILSPLKSGAARTHWRRNESYWVILAGASKSSFKVTAQLIKAGVVFHIVDSFLGKDSPLASLWDDGGMVEGGTKKMIDLVGPRPHNNLLGVCGHIDGAWSEAFHCAALIVTAAWPYKNDHASLEDAQKPSTLRTPMALEVDPLTIRSLTMVKFYEDALALGTRCAITGQSLNFVDSLSDIVEHCSFRWSSFSRHMMRILVEGLLHSNAEGTPMYFKVLNRMLDIQDGLQTMRVELVLFEDSIESTENDGLVPARLQDYDAETPVPPEQSPSPKCRWTLRSVFLKHASKEGQRCVAEAVLCGILKLGLCNASFRKALLSKSIWGGLQESIESFVSEDRAGVASSQNDCSLGNLSASVESSESASTPASAPTQAFHASPPFSDVELLYKQLTALRMEEMN